MSTMSCRGSNICGLKDKICVVIPAYNEYRRVPEFMKNVISLMEKYPGVAVIVSDDGSIDGTVERIERHNISDDLKILRCEHTGKWGALRSGFRKAKADYVLFLDFDFSVECGVLDKISDFDGDILVGNRYDHPGTQVPFKRRVLSKGFSFLVSSLSGLEVKDTQCPMKLIRKTKLLSDVMLVMQETGFVGDIEFLMMAKRMGAKIEEVPVKYIYKEGAFNVMGNTKKMFFGLLRVVKRCR